MPSTTLKTRLAARRPSLAETAEIVAQIGDAQGHPHPQGLGNEWARRGVQLDLRHYIPLFRPGVLAWRLAAARSC